MLSPGSPHRRSRQVLDARGFYDEALPLLSALLEESRRDRGAEHEETLAAQGSTAQLLYHMGPLELGLGGLGLGLGGWKAWKGDFGDQGVETSGCTPTILLESRVIC